MICPAHKIPDRPALPGYTTLRYTLADTTHHAFSAPAKLLPQYPFCGSSAIAPCQARTHAVRDVPLHGHPVLLHIEQPTMHCGHCGSDAETPLPRVHLAHRVTDRLVQWMRDESTRGRRAEIAARVGMPTHWVDNVVRHAGVR